MNTRAKMPPMKSFTWGTVQVDQSPDYPPNWQGSVRIRRDAARASASRIRRSDGK